MKINKTIIIVIIISSIILMISCNTGKKAVESDQSISKNQTKVNKDNSEWWGTYFANIARSGGYEIEIQFSITKNSNYIMVLTDKENQVSTYAFGLVSWDKKRESFILEGITPKNEYRRWKLDGEQMFLLDTMGNLFANKNEYSLKKIQREEYDTYILNKTWSLEEIKGDLPIYSEGNSEVQFSFSNDGKLFGSLSCNNFNTTYILKKGNKISFSGMLRTKKLCTDMSLENDFVKFFGTINAYEIENGILIFKDEKGNFVMKFEEIYSN